jgi:DNA polymerase III sliding clamp (beta) subunit (PCNA family)
MKLNKEELKKALELVKPGLANKEVIEQSTAFAFINGRVVTYNDEISVSHPIAGLEITGAIRAEELYKFLAKVKTEEIDVTLNGEEIQLKAGRATSGFTLITEIRLPLEEEIVTTGKWFKLPEKFLEFLRFTATGCSSNMSDPKLTCVHINKAGFIESSDNMRITHCTLPKELPIVTCLIPATSVNTIVKLNPVKVSEGNGWVHFRTADDTVISCRTFKETFVDTAKYLGETKGVKIELPAKLKEILDLAIIFTSKEQGIEPTVDIELDGKFITVKSQSESSWFKERAQVKYAGEPIAFTIVPNLLKDILSHTNECLLAGSLLYFKGDDWTYITSLRIVK